MKKLILTLTAAALFVPTFAVAKQRAVVEDCLKGKRQTQSCYTLIANYWQHAPTIERVAREVTQQYGLRVGLGFHATH